MRCCNLCNKIAIKLNEVPLLALLIVIVTKLYNYDHSVRSVNRTKEEHV